MEVDANCGELRANFCFVLRDSRVGFHLLVVMGACHHIDDIRLFRVRLSLMQTTCEERLSKHFGVVEISGVSPYSPKRNSNSSSNSCSLGLARQISAAKAPSEAGTAVLEES